MPPLQKLAGRRPAEPAPEKLAADALPVNLLGASNFGIKNEFA
jgi:hypothetical protein